MKKYGHIKISRKAFDPVDGDPYWHEPRKFSRWEAWVDLLQLAQWTRHTMRTQYGPVTLERGEFIASVRHLAKEWKWGKDKVASFLKELKKSGRITRQSDGHAGTVYLIEKYDTYQGNNITAATDDQTDEPTDARQTPDKNNTSKAGKAVKASVTSGDVTGGYPPEFELSWNAFPKRSGTNNKQAAYRQYVARLAEGISFQVIHDGVLRYNTWVVASAKVGTDKVMMASTFLGRDKHFLEPYELPTHAPAQPESPHHERAKLLYRLYLDHAFTRVQTEEAYKLEVKRLATDGTVTEPRRFWAELKVVKPWTWMGTVRTQDQAKAIAKIAELIATVPPVLEAHVGGAAA